jgi:hypothetical protein
MLKAVDFKCVCGEIIEDYIMRNEEDIPTCSCGKKMIRLFTRPVYKQKHKDHPYPTHNLGAGERARFGNKPNFD